MNRTTFLIDGFNLYHSLVEASRHLKGISTKWLDIRALCKSYLSLIGNNAQIETIYYFSALAEHLKRSDPGKVLRHQDFIKCLESTGIVCQLGRFKQKTVHCNGCAKDIIHHEEKETDVAISVKLIEIFMKDECDTAVLITGDTDLVPAVNTAKRLFPHKTTCFLFPYRRKNNELEKISDKSFTIKKERYAQYQFPDPVLLPTGIIVKKPRPW